MDFIKNLKLSLPDVRSENSYYRETSTTGWGLQPINSISPPLGLSGDVHEMFQVDSMGNICDKAHTTIRLKNNEFQRMNWKSTDMNEYHPPAPAIRPSGLPPRGLSPAF